MYLLDCSNYHETWCGINGVIKIKKRWMYLKDYNFKFIFLKFQLHDKHGGHRSQIEMFDTILQIFWPIQLLGKFHCKFIC